MMHLDPKPTDSVARDPVLAPPEQPVAVDAVPRGDDRVDAWGESSFPASDPPSWWAG